jgi:hypothetical protein
MANINMARRKELNHRIDKIEAAYEFMLAYAAQGHESDQETDQGEDIRRYLNDIDESLVGLGEIIRAVAEEKNGSAVDTYVDFIHVLESDSGKTRGAVRLVLAQTSISSQLIDNLNASIHIRALLTDLYILDEALK